MTQTEAKLPPLLAAQRVALSLVGSILLVLLAVARVIEPAEEGWGSHQQLGLPGCSFRSTFGQPCPSCGMTTAWAWAVRGELGRAVETNAAGTVLALAAVPLAAWLLASAARGRWVGFEPGPWVTASAVLALGAVMIIDWLRRLWEAAG